MSDNTEGSSGKGRKRKSKPTNSTRNRRQKIKANYAKAREDAQLAGLIPTTPEGAVRSEQVNPNTQREPALPDIVRTSLKEGWATPDSAKPRIVASLLEAFYNDELVIDESGKIHYVKPSRKLLNELAKTLLILDKTQFERDNPELAAKAKGGTVINNNNTQNNIDAAIVIRRMIEDGQLGILEEVSPSDITGTSSSGGQQREMEASSSSTNDEQRTSESMANGELKTSN